MFTENGLDWNAGIIEGVEREDNSLNKIVSRTAKRIADKGFGLLDITRVNPRVPGFNWGRSSHANVNRVVWSITFENDKNEEFAICIVDESIDYIKGNPYDHVPKESGARSVTIRADEKSQTVLGWKK